MLRYAWSAVNSAGPTKAAVLRNGVQFVQSWVSSGPAAIGSTVQNAEAGPAGRTIPVTTRVWPAALSREPTRRPSRAAVTVVTATWNVPEVPCRCTVAGREPAARTDWLARVLR